MQFISMTARHFREITSKNKPSKYHAQKTTVDNITYDSKWEAEKGAELELLQKSKHIRELERQKRFILQDGFINNQGQKVRSISYIADFYYFDISKKRYVVMDTKSPATRTTEYRIKKKLFEAKYKDVLFIESFKK